jgi:hypothetical protein
MPSPASVRSLPAIVPFTVSLPVTWAELISTTPARQGESDSVTVTPLSAGLPTAPRAPMGNDPPSVRATPQPRRLSPTARSVTAIEIG